MFVFSWFPGIQTHEAPKQYMAYVLSDNPCTYIYKWCHYKQYYYIFFMLTGQRTTLHTDKCTGRITRLCTSAALGGLNLTGKQVVCTVSILKILKRFFPLPYPSMWKKARLQHHPFIYILYSWLHFPNMHEGMFVKRQHIFRWLSRRKECSNITSLLAQTPWMKGFSGKGQKG